MPLLDSGTTGFSPFVAAQDYSGASDYAQLTAAMAALSTGGTLVLEPAKTYTLTREWIVTKKCTIIGNGATITAASDLTTTTTSGATAGSSVSVSVTDSTGFTAGDKVGFVSGVANADVVHAETTIDSVTNSTTVVISSLSGTVPSGSTMVRTCDLISITASNVRVEDLIFDGNASGRTATESWQFNWLLHSNSNPVHIRDVTIQNTPCESLLVGAGSTVENLTGDTLNGSMVHMTSSSAKPYNNGFRLRNIIGKDVCQSANNGHNESWLVFSSNVYDVSVDTFRIENCGTAAIGDMQAGDGKAKYRNGIVNGSSSGCLINASTTNAVIEDIVISDCRFIDCGDFLFSGNNIRQGYGIRGVTIENAYFENCRIDFKHSAEVLIDKVVQRFTSSYAESTAARTHAGAFVFQNFDKVTIRDLVTIGTHAYVAGIDYGLLLYLEGESVRKNSAGVSYVHLYPTEVRLSNITIANYAKGLSVANSTNEVWTRSVTGWSWNDVNIYGYREDAAGSVSSSWGFHAPAGCEINRIKVYCQHSTSNTGYYPGMLYGIDNATGDVTNCRGPIVKDVTLFVFASQTVRGLCCGGTTAGRSRDNIIVRDFKVIDGAIGYRNYDATVSDCDAAVDIGDALLPNMTSEDIQLFHDTFENAGQY